VFTEYRRKWYPEGKKIIPRDLKLTPLILARWIADDGCIMIKNNNSYRISFSTDCFSYNDVMFLKQLIEEFINKPLSIEIHGKNKENEMRYRIVSSHNASVAIIDIIKPHLIEMGMERKIPNKIIRTNKRFIKQNKLLYLIKDNKGCNLSYIINSNIGYKNKKSILYTLNQYEGHNAIYIDRSNKDFKFYIKKHGEFILNDESFYEINNNYFNINKPSKYQ